ncbi:hypothetical protein RF11_09325 [Thelohanellus kitauei]|uniref:Uncharacterized protein n=1 Tax=Thelohanellus kitauei TaxID=669202 RepID=A0A0C2IMV0_THEKT|nr:hypothetical protein RF11_09325 [Thelohanellus kitauei]
MVTPCEDELTNSAVSLNLPVFWTTQTVAQFAVLHILRRHHILLCTRCSRPYDRLFGTRHNREPSCTWKIQGIQDTPPQYFLSKRRPKHGIEYRIIISVPRLLKTASSKSFQITRREGEIQKVGRFGHYREIEQSMEPSSAYGPYKLWRLEPL